MYPIWQQPTPQTNTHWWCPFRHGETESKLLQDIFTPSAKTTADDTFTTGADDNAIPFIHHHRILIRGLFLLLLRGFCVEGDAEEEATKQEKQFRQQNKFPLFPLAI